MKPPTGPVGTLHSAKGLQIRPLSPPLPLVFGILQAMQCPLSYISVGPGLFPRYAEGLLSLPLSGSLSLESHGWFLIRYDLRACCIVTPAR